MSPSPPRPGWPSGPVDLLLKVIALPDARAAEAWRQWSATRDIDGAAWNEIRLLSAAMPRIAALDPDSPLRPRLEGIRRFVWTRNQVRLLHGLPFFDVLAGAGVQPMVLKGGARVAMDADALAERYMRDLDVLIAPGDVERAVESLLAANYRPVTGKLPCRVRAVPFDQAYCGGPSRAERGAIDFHCCALRYGRWGRFDASLWDRARPAELRGRRVRIPSPSDQLVMAIAHGMIADTDRPSDWAVDALAAAGQAGFSWETVLEETLRRRIAVPMSVGLAYLAEELDLAVPTPVRHAIDDAARNPLFRLEFLAETQTPGNRNLAQQLAATAGEAVRSRRVGRRGRGPKTEFIGRPALAPPGKGTGAPAPLPAELDVPAGALRTGLVVRVDALPARNRASYDLLVDGRWIGRLKVRLTWLDRVLKRRSWRFTIPLPPGGQRLRIVPLGRHGAPLDTPAVPTTVALL